MKPGGRAIEKGERAPLAVNGAFGCGRVAALPRTPRASQHQ